MPRKTRRLLHKMPTLPTAVCGSLSVGGVAQPIITYYQSPCRHFQLALIFLTRRILKKRKIILDKSYCKILTTNSSTLSPSREAFCCIIEEYKNACSQVGPCEGLRKH
ncbi:hypothetical protein [Coxiella endosymbiont of Ornithodoros maritimus]|uniref:hypothetical protein n=1 Tax=Coxiella endosymbiont of Ornithodoros maritimus TaxID=1656172 RepID=UPI002264AEC2|nr:hypothetical protein [Coxiella endosymbiont of Ornithodoros maritimus]